MLIADFVPLEHDLPVSVLHGLRRIALNPTNCEFRLADDETSPLSFADKAKNSKEELQTRLEIFLQQNKSHKSDRAASVESGAKSVRNTPAFSSFTSSNTSPVSTLTGSSEADVPRTLQESGVYGSKICSESIGSLMSVSMSGQSNGSMSPSVLRRHSVTSELHRAESLGRH